MALRIVEALKQESLADELARDLLAEIRRHSVFEQATVVVQNAGLGRWLQLWYARKSGIAAGVNLPFARGYIAEILERNDLYQPAEAWNEERMRWRIFSLLRKRVFDKWGGAGEPLAKYLDERVPHLELRTWRLAGKIANAFDQYSIYRPQWLLGWASEDSRTDGLDHGTWQRLLFLEMIGGEQAATSLSKRMLGLALYATCKDKRVLATTSPSVYLFGVSSFPPLFLQFFRQLSEQCAVTMYHLVGSEAFLGDLPKNYRAHLLRMSAQAEEVPLDWSDNALLVASGQSMARFQSLLLALDFSIGDVIPPEKEELSGDLLSLQHGLRRNAAMPALVADGSLSIHACHSPLREVQVLQQQLLAILAREEDLRPEHILVMMPNVEEYAAAIDAVFSVGCHISSRGGKVYLPFCIGDQPSQNEEDALRFLGALLNALRGRQTFSEVAGLFEFAPLRDKLRLSEEQVVEFFSHLQEAGVRWGMNADQRVAQGHPDFSEYTWDHGLGRMLDFLLRAEGYPLPAEFAEAMGVLAECLRLIHRFLKVMDQSFTVEGWNTRLLQMVENLLGQEQVAQEWSTILALHMSQVGTEAGEESLQFATYVEVLQAGSQRGSSTGGLLRRGITFCRLQPVRHIPARVICLLGMNEGAYPRQMPALEFDLLTRQKKSAQEQASKELALTEIEYLGDPRPREEDRQLFLDTILSARDYLYFSYVGQDEKTNERIPPSVLLRELKDFVLGQGAEREDVWERICLFHPLQEWSQRNFIFPQSEKGMPLVPLHFDASQGETRVSEEEERFSASQEPPVLLREECSLTELVRFWKDPAEYFIKSQLGATSDPLRFEEAVSDWESFDFNALDKWQLQQNILAAWMEHREKAGGQKFVEQDYDLLRKRWHADLLLPAGQAGKVIWKKEVQPVIAFLDEQISGEIFSREKMTCETSSIRIVDTALLLGERQFIFIGGDLEETYLLEAYARHVLGKRSSLLVSLKTRSAVEVPCVERDDQVEAWLDQWISFYLEGQKSPLPFSRRIAYEFVKNKLASSAPDDDSLLNQAVAGKWDPYRAVGDQTEAQKMCFAGMSPAQGGSPLREQFKSIAEAVYALPMQWKQALSERSSL